MGRLFVAPPRITPEEAAGPIINAGPLAGLSGVLPVEPVASQAGKPIAKSLRLEITENQAKHIGLLEELLAKEGHSQEVRHERWISSQTSDRWAAGGRCGAREHQGAAEFGDCAFEEELFAA